jgi:hypothetical protein
MGCFQTGGGSRHGPSARRRSARGISACQPNPNPQTPTLLIIPALLTLVPRSKAQR